MIKKKPNKSVKRKVSNKSRRKAKVKSQQPFSTEFDFLNAAHEAVRSHLSASTDLPTFLASAGTLTLANRQRIIEQALILMEENYVHLPLKISMHGVNPIQKLRLLKHQLDQSTAATMGSEFEFHRELIDIFNSVRDLHTNYLLPQPFADKVVFLPFDIEEYFDEGTPHYVVTHLVPGFIHRHFKKGVEITMWNGVPIDRAIEVSANQHAGSNLPARHARGVDGLTVRALRRSLPPDAMWVVIGFKDVNGVDRELKQKWLVSPMLPDLSDQDVDRSNLSIAACQAIDIEADIKQRARKMLYAPSVIAQEKSKRKFGRASKDSLTIDTNMPGVFSAKTVTTPHGKYGYIRIFTFSVQDPRVFIDEFSRLIASAPKEGLILDVRGNGGGHIYASEGLLQLLTPFEVSPEPTQFINTPLNARICQRHRRDRVGIDLGPWFESIRDSIKTGATYSRGFPITPREFANNRGQEYHGPVVLITDARCYSATDIFAAGFKDHNIGHMLGVEANTGAGGANVWTHDLISTLLRLPAPVDRNSPYKQLPQGANMRVSIRRTLRVGEQSGTPVEDLGVTPDSLHRMTKNDVLNLNEDLINEAAQILKRKPVRSLEVLRTRQFGSTLSIHTKTFGIDRLDFYLDQVPLESLTIRNGDSPRINLEVDNQITLLSRLRIHGFKNGAHVATRKLRLN